MSHDQNGDLGYLGIIPTRIGLPDSELRQGIFLWLPFVEKGLIQAIASDPGSIRVAVYCITHEKIGAITKHHLAFFGQVFGNDGAGGFREIFLHQLVGENIVVINNLRKLNADKKDEDL